MLNIVVYWCAPNMTCAQQIFQVHTTETDELMNVVFLYVPLFKRDGRFLARYDIWERAGGGEQGNMSVSFLI